jgi:DNA-binding protein HU-beta
VNKRDLIKKIAQEAELSNVQAARALDAFLDSVQSSLIKGDRVTLVGFGTFSIGKRKARVGRNPQTGKEIKIPAKKVPKFTAGKALKAAVK